VKGRRIELAQRAVRSPVVVELEILAQAGPQVAQVVIFAPIDFLILHAAPESLDEDVIQSAPSPVHGNANRVILQKLGEGDTGKLKAVNARVDLTH